MAFENYTGRCTGRLNFFLCKYCREGDKVIYQSDGKSITLDGKLFATYTWDGDTDVPTFTFVGEFKDLNKIQAQMKPDILLVDKKRKELGMHVRAIMAVVDRNQFAT